MHLFLQLFLRVLFVVVSFLWSFWFWFRDPRSVPVDLPLPLPLLLLLCSFIMGIACATFGATFREGGNDRDDGTTSDRPSAPISFVRSTFVTAFVAFMLPLSSSSRSSPPSRSPSSCSSSSLVSMHAFDPTVIFFIIQGLVLRRYTRTRAQFCCRWTRIRLHGIFRLHLRAPDAGHGEMWSKVIRRQ
jgi:hypothetical protein